MCGIIGIVGKQAVTPALYDALGILQHRGQDAAGIATLEGHRIHLFKGNGLINAEIAAGAMDMLKVDACGFDTMDRRLLKLIIENFDGGPVGIESIAAALSEERGTVEDVLEPFLIQQGYITRTSRGRMVTAKAYMHFGLEQPGNDKNNGNADLFSGK